MSAVSPDEAQRQCLEAAQRVDAGAAGLSGRLDPACAPGECGQHGLAFHPGERHAQAGMESVAEGEVSGGPPGDVIGVRIGPLARVAVDAGEFDLSGGGPEVPLVGRVEAQRFFEGSARGPSGSERIAEYRSGWWARHHSALPSAWTVVSIPAERSARTSMPPSAAADLAIYSRIKGRLGEELGPEYFWAAQPDYESYL